MDVNGQSASDSCWETSSCSCGRAGRCREAECETHTSGIHTHTPLTDYSPEMFNHPVMVFAMTTLILMLLKDIKGRT